MKDRDELLKMAQSGDERILFAKCLDKAVQAEVNHEKVLGDFCDPGQMSALRALFRKRGGDVGLFAFGGFEQAERLRLCFSRCDWEPTPEAFRLAVMRLIPRARAADLDHRSVLGAVMSLGIKREKIGDIVVFEGYACVVLDETLAEQATLAAVGKEAVTVDLVDTEFLHGFVPEVEIASVTVASLRLDAIIAAVFRLSRSQSAESITKGLVKVNHAQVTDTSRAIKSGDVISMRGHGRVTLGNILGKTQKGRIRAEIIRPRQ